MRDISYKQQTLRTAKAVAVVYCSPTSIEVIRQENLPKGNLFDVARAAAFIGAKSAPMLLPHCHPVNIDGMEVQFEFLAETSIEELSGEQNKTGIVIIGEARSIGRTGIEMEVLTGVSVAALEIYDMLKPIDKKLQIGNIQLLNKTGGKSDRTRFSQDTPLCAVLVCSDSVASGKNQDNSGRLMQEMLEVAGAEVMHYEVVPDDENQIRNQLLSWIDEDVHFIFTTGGTGFGSRDVTVSVVEKILDKTAHGIAEAIRGFGQMRTPLAMMSNLTAGTVKNTTIVTLPGSPDAVKEGLSAILPSIFHSRKMLLGGRH